MRMMGAMFMLFVQAASASDALEPWASNSQPGDAPKQHVEKVTAAKHPYTVTQGGTMDGANCRSPLGVGMHREGVIEQTWESNRSVRMENTGETDVIHPWLSNGRNTFRSLSEIAANAVTKEMSDHEKAMALWFQQIKFRYHMGGDNVELCDPVKVFNSYGYNTCGNDSICLGGLWQKTGLKVAPARGVGHCISQVFYDGWWHLLDGDQHVLYLLRDNQTIAGELDIARDHDLIRRTHTSGIFLDDKRSQDEWESALYGFDGEVKGQRGCKDGATMNMVLRPGEALVWRWGHLTPVKCRGGKPLYPDMICNGLWEYRPDFAKAIWRKGATQADGVQEKDGALAAEAGKPGTVIWTIRCPYVLLGGRIEAEAQGVTFALSFDGKTWQDAKDNLDACFPTGGPARYEYQLKAAFAPGGKLSRLRIVNDLQMAPLLLPAMTVGENNFVYTDETPGERQVAITHAWVERSASAPPDAPSEALAPADGGEHAGTDVVFRWKAPDGKIADYHFELSNRADMKWPLSTNFYKLISRTTDRGKAQYTLPEAGLLAPDRVYYWHVRAKNGQGVWGPWSKTWSFTPRGPSYPLEVAVAFDEKKGQAVLSWKPNPVGRAPAKYRVYGSDEKGFSVSDEPYRVEVGSTKDLNPQFPGNFIAEVSGTELAVLGPQVALPAANKSYYRVVAVDDRGKRSGPSDYAAAPRPVLYSTPPTAAKVGAAYTYQAKANRSLGDLRARNVDGREVRAFFEIEKTTFAVEQAPAWLKLDPATGLLSGTPDAAGRFTLTLVATNSVMVEKPDEAQLVWGNYKVASKTEAKTSSAPQTFTIEVAP